MARDHDATAPAVAPSRTPVWDLVRNAPTPEARRKASYEALALVSIPDLARPTPALFLDLPWQDSEQAQQDILARLIGADDIDAATRADQALPDMSTYVGQTVTVHQLVARRGTIDEAWGAYLSLDVTVAGQDGHRAVNTSSAEVVVVCWLKYVRGQIPFTAHVILKGQPQKGRNQPIGLVVIDAFT